jgi:hypothetical protein
LNLVLSRPMLGNKCNKFLAMLGRSSNKSEAH